MLNKYGIRPKRRKLERIKDLMAEKKDFHRGGFVRKHERAARQLTDNIWGESMNAYNLADLAEDARSQD